MKKIIALVLALVMIASLGVSSFAISADSTNIATPQNGDTIVKTDTLKDTNGDGTGDTNAENYEVSYPASTTIPWEAATATVEYDVATQLMWYNQLKVTVAGTDKMSFTTTGLLVNTTYDIPYTLSGDKDITVEPAVTATKTLNVAIEASAWAAAPIAEYQDTLTFTTSVFDARA